MVQLPRKRTWVRGGERMIKKALSLYLAFFMAGIGIPQSLFAQQKPQYTIAVLNMDAKGVSQVEAEVLSERLRNHISQLVVSGTYRGMENRDQYLVVEQTQVDKIFDQFEIQNLGCVSDSCAIEFGKMLQVDRIVIGQVGLVGNTYSVSARIIDVESRKAIASADRQYRGSIDDVMSKVINEVGNELMMGKQEKKSYKKWYIIAGGLIVGAGAAALAGGGGGGGDDGGGTLLPDPPGHP
jgi:hypothetical protein